MAGARSSVRRSKRSHYLNKTHYISSLYTDIKVWREKPSKSYDSQYIVDLTASLRKARLSNEPHRVMHIIRAHTDRNVANILNLELYTSCYIGTKTIIEDYQNEVSSPLCFFVLKVCV